MAVGSSATLSIRDFGVDLEHTEISTMTVPSYQIDAANLATWLTGWGAFKTANDAVILGVQAKETINLYNTVLSSAIPASQVAQRESKVMVTFTGNTNGKKYRVEIPTVDLASLTLGADDSVVLADGGIMAAWVTAFEAIARDPFDDSEEVTVVGAKAVGRNS